MKIKILLLCVAFFVLLLNACSNSAKKQDLSTEITKQFGPIERSFDVIRDSLDEENWLEVEKNEIVKICVDVPVVAWKTSLKSSILNDSCLIFQAPTLVGVDTVKVFFPEADTSNNINLAVGMKYLNFKNEKVLLGFNEYSEERQKILGEKNTDPERLASVTGTYLVDKYPVTNCEFIQVLWDSIPEKATYDNKLFIEQDRQKWLLRRKNSKRNENCVTHDTATNVIPLFQTFKYANARSAREGLKPYYIFSDTIMAENGERAFYNNGSYGFIVYYWDFKQQKNRYVKVSVDESSDGYRLPYYDEWMMFARGGDKKNRAPWGDSTATLEEAQKYAQFNSVRPRSAEEESILKPVGLLQPNGYGLYDMFGLVEERVLVTNVNIRGDFGFPSLLKGGGYWVELTEEGFNVLFNPYWKWIDYGYFHPGHHGTTGGFRLIRNIGKKTVWNDPDKKIIYDDEPFYTPVDWGCD